MTWPTSQEILGQQISSHSFHDDSPPLLDKEIRITIATIPQSAGEVDSLLMSKWLNERSLYCQAMELKVFVICSEAEGTQW